MTIIKALPKQDEPAPYCLIPVGYKPYVPANRTNVRATWERAVPGWWDKKPREQRA